jgi:hypothetical protein
VEEYFRPQFEVLLRVLADLVPAGIDPARLHQLAFSVVGQCLYYRVADSVVRMLVAEDEIEAKYSVEQLAEHIVGVTLGGAQELRESNQIESSARGQNGAA